MAGATGGAIDVPLFDFGPVRRETANARAKRKKATTRAAVHADKARDGWVAEAAEYLLTFGTFVADGPFLVETARAWAERQGFAKPPDGRAWGAVPACLVGERKLEASGFGRASDGSPKTAWRVTAAGVKAARRPGGAA